jgi:predicted nucleic acid-binding protein
VTSALAYLDASAIVKLAVREAETAALETYVIARRALLSSRLGAAEALRAERRAGQSSRVDEALAALFLCEVTVDILHHAAALAPASLRTGDAIHLATALAIGDPHIEFVTYDRRLAKAAGAAGLHVVHPGRVEGDGREE